MKHTIFIILVTMAAAAGHAVAEPLHQASLNDRVDGRVILQDDALLMTARVEAGLPRLTPRPLSGAERATLRTLSRASSRDRTDAWFAQLRPLAEAGDKEAMLLMMNSVGSIAYKRQVQQQRVGDRTPEDRRADMVGQQWAGAWAAAVWELHGPDRHAALRIRGCFDPESMTPTVNGRVTLEAPWPVNCGFTVSYRAQPNVSFLRYEDGKSRPPADIVFTHYMVALSPEQAQLRFEAVIGVLNGGRYISNADRAWAEDYARVTGRTELLHAAFVGNAALQRAAERRKEAARQEANANWTPQDQWRADLSGFDAMSWFDRGMMERQAIEFGDEFVMEIAREHDLSEKRAIAVVCRHDETLCQTQTQAYEARIEAGRLAAQAARASPGRNTFGSAPSALVELRTYDAQGNYLGSETVSSTIADLRSR